MTPDRIARVRREKGKALVRAMYLAEFQAAGAARAVALDHADEQLDRIARALPNALNAGLSLTEIARSAAVSRQTLYELKARYDPSGDLYLAVLQSVATREPISISELAEWLRKPTGDITLVVDEFLDQGLMSLALVPGDEDGSDYLCLTDAGSSRLSEWWSQTDEAGEHEV